MQVLEQHLHRRVGLEHELALLGGAVGQRGVGQLHPGEPAGGGGVRGVEVVADLGRPRLGAHRHERGRGDERHLRAEDVQEEVTNRLESDEQVFFNATLSTSIGLLLPAIIWTYAVAGTLDFRPGGILSGNIGPAAATVLLALFLFGVAKAAVMPVHRWLPAAMVAPTPVSALLHAVAVVKAGVFSVIAVAVYIFGIDLLAATSAALWIAWVAGFTIVAASIIALRKDDLKARLAYSTISQLGYITLGALLATSAGIIGGSMHIADMSLGHLGANAIVGGGIPTIVGAALSYKTLSRQNVSVAFFGDGAVNIGSVLETMNLAAAWALPICFFIENNLYAVSTHVAEVTGEPRLSGRGPGFGIPSVRVDGNDVPVPATQIDGRYGRRPFPGHVGWRKGHRVRF